MLFVPSALQSQSVFWRYKTYEDFYLPWWGNKNHCNCNKVERRHGKLSCVFTFCSVASVSVFWYACLTPEGHSKWCCWTEEWEQAASCRRKVVIFTHLVFQRSIIELVVVNCPAMSICRFMLTSLVKWHWSD